MNAYTITICNKNEMQTESERIIPKLKKYKYISVFRLNNNNNVILDEHASNCIERLTAQRITIRNSSEN